MAARIAKTVYLQQDREGFLRQLAGEIQAAHRKAQEDGLQLVCRLNAFSDLPWEHASYGSMPAQFPDVLFYDYCKTLHRVGKTPANYSLCASWDGLRNGDRCIELLNSGHNVAVVFADNGGFCGAAALRQRIPHRWKLPGSDRHWECFDGDVSDLRLHGVDPGPTRAGYGRICALRLKAGSNEERAAAIESGFCQIVK